MKWLLVATALVLTAEPASAEPITTAIAAFSATLGAGSGVFAALGAGFTALSSTFVGRLIVGVGLSLVSQMFAPKLASNIRNQGIQTEQTTVGDTTPVKFVVGRYALEGHAVAPAYSRSEDNRILTYILEVSNIPVTGLTGRVIVDGQYTDLVASDDDAERLDFDSFGVDNAGNAYGWLWFYDGTQTTASAPLVTFYGSHPDRPWTTDHKLLKSAYAVCEFGYDREVYNSLPSVRFEVDGIALYDPRKDTTVGGSGSHRWDDPDTWEFTKNPQVISYNIHRGITLPTGDIWGGQVPGEDLPLDNWFAAMNECDVLIGDRPQYEAGFEINTNTMEPFEVIEEMNRASFAQPSEFGGVFRVRVGAPAAAVMSLTDDDFVITEPSRYDPFPGLAGTFNAATGTYVEPADLWQGRAADAVLNSTWEAEDGGRRLTVDINLPSVANKSQAQQLLTAYIKDQRRFRTHSMVLPPSFALLEPLDSVSFTSEVNGYEDKIFEVVKVEHRPDTLNQSVVVRERDAGDVDWSSDDDVDPPEAVYTLTVPPDFVDDFEDPDAIWNGNFKRRLRGWSSDLAPPTAISVVRRDSASGHLALQVAPAANVLKMDFGPDLLDSVSEISSVLWDGYIPVDPATEVYMRFMLAGGTEDEDYVDNIAFCRGVLRWYDEDKVQLSDPDDETVDFDLLAFEVAAISAGRPLWATFQRTGFPPEDAAFCRPYLRFEDTQAWLFCGECRCRGPAFDTAACNLNSVTEK